MRIHTNQDMPLLVYMYEAMQNDDLLLSKLPYGIPRKKVKFEVASRTMIMARVEGEYLELEHVKHLVDAFLKHLQTAAMMLHNSTRPL